MKVRTVNDSGGGEGDGGAPPGNHASRGDTSGTGDQANSAANAAGGKPSEIKGAAVSGKKPGDL